MMHFHGCPIHRKTLNFIFLRKKKYLKGFYVPSHFVNKAVKTLAISAYPNNAIVPQNYM